MPERFAFRFSYESPRHLMLDANARSDPTGVSKDASDPGRLEGFRIASVAARNE
jgi:hypothetical protein